MESSFRDFKDGDIVEGEVVKIDRDEVLLDIGYKSEGVIPSKELSIRHDVKPAEVVQVGEHIEALVLQKEDKEGRLILSKKRAQYERAWGRIEEVMQSGQTIKGPVIEVVKGGLILDIGLRGFLPASLVDLRRVRDLQPFVGTELECKIIELDRNRNNVVLSRRAFLEESQSEGRKTFLQNLQKGERRKGTVSSIVNFGAFVDLGGVDGLVHVSRAVVEARRPPAGGRDASARRSRSRCSTSTSSASACRCRSRPRRRTPGRSSSARRRPAPIIDGTVTKLVPFGAFVRVAQGIEGLVHISEISHEHVDAPESVLSVGQEVKVKVIDVDVSRRRVSLSMRQVTSAPPKPKEIEVEPEVARDAGPEMSTAIEVPAEILAAVAAAEAAGGTVRLPQPAPTAAAGRRDRRRDAGDRGARCGAGAGAEVAAAAPEVAAARRAGSGAGAESRPEPEVAAPPEPEAGAGARAVRRPRSPRRRKRSRSRRSSRT